MAPIAHVNDSEIGSKDQDEFVTIRPRQVALSHQRAAESAKPRFSPMPWLIGGGLVLLVALGLWVFLYLPDRIQQPVLVRAPEPPVVTPAPQPAVAAAAPHMEPTAAPYEELQIERERKRAQETLARF